jgi:hypothetical protein
MTSTCNVYDFSWVLIVVLLFSTLSVGSVWGGVTTDNGVHFKTLVSKRVWLVPENEPNAKTPIKLGLRITNKKQKSIRFCRFDTLFPEIVQQDGKALQPDGGRDVTFKIKESDCPLLMPGESVAFFLDGIIYWQNDILRLEVSDGFGGLWYFNELSHDTYKVRFIFRRSKATIQIYEPESRILEDIWTGQVTTPFVEVQLIRH